MVAMMAAMTVIIVAMMMRKKVKKKSYDGSRICDGNDNSDNDRNR